MTLAALEATLRLYLDEQLARKRIPTVAMITAAPDELKRRASRLASRLRKACGDKAEIRLARENPASAAARPENALPTTLVRAVPTGCTPECLKQRLLETVPPLIGRLEDHAFPARSAHADRRGTAHGRQCYRSCAESGVSTIAAYPDTASWIRPGLSRTERGSRKTISTFQTIKDSIHEQRIRFRHQNGWTHYADAASQEQMDVLATRYMDFLSHAKTERETVDPWLKH